jgi:hypothetical protein
MNEVTIALCLGVIGLLQVLACRRGLAWAVPAYLVLSPLSYFSVYSAGVIGPEKICTLIFVLWQFLTRKHWLKSGNPSVSLKLLVWYGVIITMTAAPFWPTRAMDADSPVYTILRAPVQVVQWLAQFSIARAVATWATLADFNSQPLRLMRGCVVLICLFGLYQIIAHSLGLPYNEIRRTAEQQVDGSRKSESAFFEFAGVDIYRPGSVVGEPKGLGAYCLVHIYIMLAIAGRMLLSSRMTSVGLISIANVATLSTSSLVGLFGAQIPAIAFVCKRRALVLLSAIILLVVSCVGVVGVAASLSSGSGGIDQVIAIVSLRTIDRLEADSPLSDGPEIATIEVLGQSPLMLIAGAGLGGISFYIADYLGGSQNLILFPNNGMLGLIANVGMLGAVLYFINLFKVGSVAIMSPVQSRTKAIAVSAFALGVQYMIFPQQIMWVSFVGLSLASLTASSGSTKASFPYARAVGPEVRQDG